MKEENLKICITVAEKAKEYLNDKKEKALVESVIKKCIEWIDHKCDIAEELYDYLDNEENGFTVFQEQETDAKKSLHGTPSLMRLPLYVRVHI